MELEKKLEMYHQDQYLHSVCKFNLYFVKITFEYNSGGKEPPMNNWQRIAIDIPNDKLILSIKEARPSYMPTRIQALVVVRQRVNGIEYNYHLKMCSFLLFSDEFNYNWSLSFSTLYYSKNR
jgi:hypothetical protein